jgi:DoxX-like protein
MSNSRSNTANRLLWTAQIVAAMIFLFAGSMKFIMPADKMQQGPIIFSMAFMHFIGTCECLGALGLVLPGLFRIRTWLTPLAAAGLTIIMIGATAVTLAAMGVAPALIPAVIGLITATIAYRRGLVSPIAELPRRVLRTA